MLLFDSVLKWCLNVSQGSIGFEPVQILPGGRGTLVVVGGAAALVIGNSLYTGLASVGH